MSVRNRVFGAVVTGAVYFVVTWSFDDLKHDRAAVNAVFAVVAGLLTCFLRRGWTDERVETKAVKDYSPPLEVSLMRFVPSFAKTEAASL